MKFGLLSLLTLSMLLSCSSDETTDRDDIKLSAIYREYEVTLNLENNTVESEAYFRTSASGSHVKLSEDDRLHFKAIGGRDESLYGFKFDRKQIYFGSKNIPYYKSSKKLSLDDVTAFSWHWYDNETGQTIVDEVEVMAPADITTSHNEEDILDTTNPEDLEITFDRKLEDSEVVLVEFRSNRNNLSYRFGKNESNIYSGQDLIDDQTIRISSENIRIDSANRMVDKNESTPKKFGNLSMKVKTRESIPIIDSGMQKYTVHVSITNTSKLDDVIGKGGTVRTKAFLPVKKILINF